MEEIENISDKSGMRQGGPLFPFILNITLELLARAKKIG
jgi:hypothetical protein